MLLVEWEAEKTAILRRNWNVRKRAKSSADADLKRTELRPSADLRAFQLTGTSVYLGRCQALKDLEHLAGAMLWMAEAVWCLPAGRGLPGRRPVRRQRA